MALLAAASVPAHAGTYGGGNGTPDSPYLIETAAHLQELGTTPTDWNKDFAFVADIDLKEETVEVIGSPLRAGTSQPRPG